MKKRFLSLIVALLAAMVLVGCGNKTQAPTGTQSADLSGTYQIKVWVDEKIVELTRTQISEFNENNGKGITIEATIQATGEGDAATNMITDV